MLEETLGKHLKTQSAGSTDVSSRNEMNSEVKLSQRDLFCVL